MRRTLSLLLTLGLLVSCSDADLPSDPGTPGGAGAISDGTGTVGDVGDDPDLATANEHFFWLAPMVSQPDESQFGAFDPTMQPTVRVVCWTSTELPAADCDPSDADGPEIVDTFTEGDGLVVESDHYKVELDTRAYGLQTSGDTEFTTYRIEVLTPPLTAFGGPFVIGLADFQLGENGRDARNLDTSETIGLKDDRTLPIRFRLDEGALEEELAVNSEPTDDPTGEAAFCQINCSVTVIAEDQDTEASLTDDETGDELTAILIPAGAVANTSETAVLVIDELVDDGDQEAGELCLPFGDLPTEACFRYELSPENTDPNLANGDDFTEDVRFGICPEGEAVDGMGGIRPSWRLLKADAVDGEVVITRPTEVDVSDFLSCDVQTTAALWDGPGGQLAGAVLRWLVEPVRASDFWGGQLRDLSDPFWGEDVEMSRLTVPPASATENDTLQATVELLAIHADSAPVSGRHVTFRRELGTGLLSAPAGVVQSTQDSITVETDLDGRATVNWPISVGDNRVVVTSPHARPAPSEPDTLAFEVTGDAVLALLAPAQGELIQQNDAGIQACSLLPQRPWRGRGYQITFDWTDASGQVDAYELVGQIVGAATPLVSVTLDDPPVSEFTHTACNDFVPGSDPEATWTVEALSGGVTSAAESGSFGWTDCTLVDGTSCRSETSDTQIDASVGLENVDVTLQSCGAGSAVGFPGTCTQAGAVFSASGTTDATGQLVFDNAPEGLASGLWRVVPQPGNNAACATGSGDIVSAETLSLAQGQTATVSFVCFLTVS